MRIFLLTCAFSFISILGFSQYNVDFGVGIGAANYVGEIGGKEGDARPWLLDMKIGQTKWAVNGFYRYRFGQKLGATAGFTYGRISGADSLSTSPTRVGRNLSFRNDIFELSGRGEFYFYNINDVGHKGRYQLDFRSYVFLGVGGFYHNPQAKYQGSWEALQPLQTEGVKYSKFQVSIPAGIGIFYTYKRKHRIGWEAGVRKTFTDYLDDASTFYVDKSDDTQIAQDLANRYTGNNTDIEGKYYGPGGVRGNSKSKDWYMFTQVTYSKVLRGKGKFTNKKYSYLYSGKKRSRRTRAKF